MHGSLNVVWLPSTDPSAWSPDPSARSPELSAWSPELSAWSLEPLDWLPEIHSFQLEALSLELDRMSFPFSLLGCRTGHQVTAASSLIKLRSQCPRIVCSMRACRCLMIKVTVAVDIISSRCYSYFETPYNSFQYKQTNAIVVTPSPPAITYALYSENIFALSSKVTLFCGKMLSSSRGRRSRVVPGNNRGSARTTAMSPDEQAVSSTRDST